MKFISFQLKSLLMQIHFLSILAILLIITPYLLPLLLIGISKVINKAGYKSIVLDLLPQPAGIPDYNQNFVYFSYSGVDSAKDLVLYVLQCNKINSTIKEFPSPEEAGKYFAYKNLFLNMNQFNASFAKESYCKSLSEVGQKDCDTSYLDNYENELKLLYGYQEFPDELDEIFIHINVYETGKIQDLPLNLTVEVIVNTTMMDKLITEKPDSIHKKFEKSSYLPYWTGYGYRLQADIERFLTNYYVQVDQKVTFSVLGEIPVNPSYEISILQIFKITQALQFTILSLLCYQLASKHRGQTSNAMRNLGVYPIQFYGTTCFITFSVSQIIYMTATIIWHYSGVLPYSGMSLGFCIAQNTLICLASTMYSLLLALLLGNNRTLGFIIQCLTSLSMFLIPSVLMAFLFDQSSLFDPSLIPQWGTYLSIILFPQFAISILNEAMFSSLQNLLKIKIAEYIWDQQSSLIQLSFLQNNSPVIPCMNQKATGNIILPGLKICLFQRPKYEVIEFIVIGQCMIFLVLVGYLSHIIPEKGFVGLPIHFLFSRKFWAGFKKVPQNNSLNANNISLFYRKRMIIDSVNLKVKNSEKVALLGESSQGKTTILEYLTGGKRSKANTYSQIIYGNFDLQNRYDCFFIKPFIGYCPQDFGNVILDLTVFENVKMSLSLRQNRTRKQSTIDGKAKEQQIIIEALQKIGLGSPTVLKRQASKLSGGMLRRLACINAIIGSEYMLIFDEISAGVDPVLKRKIWEIIKQTQNSVIITTHDMGEIEIIAEKINVLHNKQLIVDDKTQLEFRGQNNAQFQIKVKLLSDQSNIIPEINGVEIQQDQTYQTTLQLTKTQYYGLVERLDNLQYDNIVEYYSLNRFKLEDIYNDMQHVLQENCKYTSVKQYKRYSKIATILKTKLRIELCYSRVSTFYIIIMLNAIFGILFGACYQIMYSNLMNINTILSNKSLLFQQEERDLFHQCYRSCQSNTKIMIQAMRLRNSQSCGWYYTFIGLDQKNNLQVYLGDNIVIENQPDFVYYIVQKAIQIEQKDLIINPGSKATGSIAKNYDFDWDGYFSQYTDPIKSLIEKGMYPYIKNYLNTDYNLYQKDIQFCKQQCSFQEETSQQCNLQFDLKQCNLVCNNKFQKIHIAQSYIPTATIVNKLSQAIDTYSQSQLFRNQYLNIPFTNSQRNIVANQFKIFNPMGIINYQKIENKQIEFDYIAMFPYRGRTSEHYTQNILKINLIKEYHQDCQGSFEKQYDNMNIASVSTRRARSSYRFHELQYRSLPYRDHVVLFDYSNNVLASQTSAILRRALYENSNDYSPQNFSYNLIQREMPVFTDIFVKNNEEIIVPPLFQLILFSIIGFMPFFFISQSVGRDHESNINTLFKFHKISQTLLFVIDFIYYLLLTFAMTSVCYLLLVAFSYQFVINTQNIITILFMSFIQAFISIPTGIIIGSLTKSGKTSTIFSFSVTTLSIVFCILNINQPTLVILISIVLPVYSISYIIQDLILGREVHITILLLSILWGVVQSLLFLLSQNLSRIKQKLNKNEFKSKKVDDCYNISYISVASDYFSQQENQFDKIMIKDAKHTYDKKIFALNGVSFDISENQVFGLLGANGSGKSTLMHSLAGVINITQGTAYLQNIDLFSVIDRSNYFTMVPQQDILYRNLSVIEHLQLFIAINSSPLSVHEILQYIDIKACPLTKANNLSGGEKRKLSLGIAMTSTAQIIALDEPSTGLGALTKSIVQNSIQHFKKIGKTVILTSHDLQEVEQAVDQLILLKDGNILYNGDINGMRQQDGFYFTADRILLEKVSKQCDSNINGNRIFFYSNKKSRLLQYLQSENIDPNVFDIDNVSLEDEFIRLVE